jgi:lipid-A-disaccharide synthase
MDKPVVKELIQQELSVSNIRRELDLILHDSQKLNDMKDNYRTLKELLQKEGNASARAAHEIVGFLQATA